MPMMQVLEDHYKAVGPLDTAVPSGRVTYKVSAFSGETGNETGNANDDDDADDANAQNDVTNDVTLAATFEEAQKWLDLGHHYHSYAPVGDKFNIVDKDRHRPLSTQTHNLLVLLHLLVARLHMSHRRVFLNGLYSGILLNSGLRPDLFLWIASRYGFDFQTNMVRRKRKDLWRFIRKRDDLLGEISTTEMVVKEDVACGGSGWCPRVSYGTDPSINQNDGDASDIHGKKREMGFYVSPADRREEVDPDSELNKSREGSMHLGADPGRVRGSDSNASVGSELTPFHLPRSLPFHVRLLDAMANFRSKLDAIYLNECAYRMFGLDETDSENSKTSENSESDSEKSKAHLTVLTSLLATVDSLPAMRAHDIALTARHPDGISDSEKQELSDLNRFVLGDPFSFTNVLGDQSHVNTETSDDGERRKFLFRIFKGMFRPLLETPHSVLEAPLPESADKNGNALNSGDAFEHIREVVRTSERFRRNLVSSRDLRLQCLQPMTTTAACFFNYVRLMFTEALLLSPSEIRVRGVGEAGETSDAERTTEKTEKLKLTFNFHTTDCSTRFDRVGLLLRELWERKKQGRTHGTKRGTENESSNSNTMLRFAEIGVNEGWLAGKLFQMLSAESILDKLHMYLIDPFENADGSYLGNEALLLPKDSDQGQKKKDIDAFDSKSRRVYTRIQAWEKQLFGADEADDGEKEQKKASNDSSSSGVKLLGPDEFNPEAAEEHNAKSNPLNSRYLKRKCAEKLGRLRTDHASQQQGLQSLGWKGPDPPVNEVPICGHPEAFRDIVKQDEKHTQTDKSVYHRTSALLSSEKNIPLSPAIIRKEMLPSRHFTILPLLATEAAQLFPDKSDADALDMVFIDGDHSYQPVKDDLLAWIPKIRVGGILAGHDFAHMQFPGVMEAVIEVLNGKSEEWPNFLEDMQEERPLFDGVLHVGGDGVFWMQV